MKVGYICKRIDENGKEIFKYREANATRRIEARTDTVKVPFLYGTIPFAELDSNTNIMSNESGVMLVNEPFFTNEETKNRVEK